MPTDLPTELRRLAILAALGCTDDAGRPPDASSLPDGHGPDAAVPVLCDGVPEWRLVALTLPLAARLEPGTQVVYENGALQIFVRGDCELWVSGATAGEVRHATLTPSRASRLAIDALYATWRDHAGTWVGEAFDGPTVVLHDGVAWTLCHQLCVGDRLPPGLTQIRPALEQALPGLQVLATPLAGPVRFMAVQVSPGNEPQGREPFLWDFEPSLAEVSLTEGEAIVAPYGSGILIDDMGIASRVRSAWRQARRDGHSHVAATDPDGRWHRVYVRDVLPFEDARGLIFPDQR